MTEEDNAATYRRWFDKGCSGRNVDRAANSAHAKGISDVSAATR